MKIKADGRGRIALAQAGISKPYQEWEVTEDSRGVHLTTPEQKSSEWRRYHPGALRPEDIGTTVGVLAVSDGLIPTIPGGSYGTSNGLYGVLEMYSCFDGVIEVKLKGHPDSITTSPIVGATQPRLTEIYLKR